MTTRRENDSVIHATASYLWAVEEGMFHSQKMFDDQKNVKRVDNIIVRSGRFVS